MLSSHVGIGGELLVGEANLGEGILFPGSLAHLAHPTLPHNLRAHPKRASTTPGTTIIIIIRMFTPQKQNAKERQKKRACFFHVLFSLLIFSLAKIQHSLVDVGHGSILVTSPLLSLESSLAVLVHLELGNDEAGGGDTDGDGGAVGLLSGDVGNVDDKLFSVAGGDLALAGLVHAAGDEDLVVLADGHGADAVTGLELLGEVGRHELSPGLRVGREVSLARLASAGGNGGGVLHFSIPNRQVDCNWVVTRREE